MSRGAPPPIGFPRRWGGPWVGRGAAVMAKTLTRAWGALCTLMAACMAPPVGSRVVRDDAEPEPQVVPETGEHATQTGISFTEVAREGSETLSAIDVEARPDLTRDGRVAFVGRDRHDGLRLFVAGANGTAAASVDVGSAGHEQVLSLQIDDAGRLAFLSRRRTPTGDEARGVYVAAIDAPIRTLVEATDASAPDGSSPPPSSNVALSPKGTIAFSTVLSAQGGVFRGSLGGTEAPSLLRSGTGTFYNTKQLDVTDGGSVAVQMEYGDPVRGLARGILLFSSAEQTLEEVSAAVEKLGIGTQPEPSMNARGEVAFFLDRTDTMPFFDPPDDRTAGPVREITLEPGVYVSTPTPFGRPSQVRQVATASGAFDQFFHVEINDAGLVVFEASLDDGRRGVYRGPDPQGDKIVEVGDDLGGERVSWVSLGELNDAGQVAVVTRGDVTRPRRLWRVGPLPSSAR